MKKIFKLLLVLFLIWISTLSCAPTKSAAYLSKSKEGSIIETPDQLFYLNMNVADTIHIGDELYITVSTGNDEPNSFTQNTGGIGGNIELLSYIVDEGGFVKLPYIKRLHISGLTINAATDAIEKELSQYLFIPTVSIRLINHRFSVLGEVNSPGLYTFNQKSINIYQAIATANDITEFGNRKNVLIVRQDGNKVYKKYVNILDENIIGSEWYIIKPDDMIFVEPMARKTFGMTTVPYGLFFSIFSTTIVTLTFLISLVNN